MFLLTGTQTTFHSTTEKQFSSVPSPNKINPEVRVSKPQSDVQPEINVSDGDETSFTEHSMDDESQQTDDLNHFSEQKVERQDEGARFSQISVD